MKKNGQITVEAILIIGFFILLFVGISMPMALNVYDYGTEASVILEMRTNLDVIVGAIKIVRAGGPGSVRTVKIKSNVANWELAAYDTDNPDVDTLTYWVKWPNAEDVPVQLITNTGDNTWGGLSVESIDGIASTGTLDNAQFLGNGADNWYVEVTNSASSTSPSIGSININGNTVEISLTG